jgi:hypothetical protein
MNIFFFIDKVIYLQKLINHIFISLKKKKKKSEDKMKTI